LDSAASRFIACIKAHDVGGLIELMSEDHVFVDSLGSRLSRPAIEQGWRQYFEMVPDYWIKIDRAISDGDTSVLIGSAGGTWVPPGGKQETENEWRTPAVWIANVRDGKISEWRVYCDNEPLREKMRGELHRH
jgi:ketosteroid isomerase-like protein